MKSYVFITGATGGLGRAFAVECACRGWNVFLTDTKEETLACISEGITNAYGVFADHQVCDLTDSASRAKLFEYVREKGYVFSGLINVAGIDFEGTFLENSREQIRTIVRLNIEANIEITHEIMKFRDKSKTFRIINVASLAAYYPIPLKATYAASKRFLLNFSLALREELRNQGVTVTALCPAGLPTNPMVIKCIEAQGMIGRWTTSDVGFVASRTIQMSSKGKAVYIPGAINHILRFLGMLVPQTWIARTLSARWKEAFKKSHGLVQEGV